MPALRRFALSAGVLLVLATLASIFAPTLLDARADAAPQAGGAQVESIASDDESRGRSFASTFFIARSTGVDGIRRTEWLGSGLIWLLMGLSAVGLGLAGSLLAANARTAIVDDELDARLGEMLGRQRFQEAFALANASRSDLGRIAAAALTPAAQGFDAMRRHAAQAADVCATARLRRIEILNVLGQVAPMIGLFGTVYGMIAAFLSIEASGGAADPVVLAGGIGTALVTTFWGLLVAIPALAFYAVLRNRVDAMSGEAEARVAEMLEPFRPRRTRNGNGGTNGGASEAGSTA